METKIYKLTFFKHLMYILPSLLSFLVVPAIFIFTKINGTREGSLLFLLFLWIFLGLFYFVGFYQHYTFYKIDRNKTLKIENNTTFTLKSPKSINSFKISDIVSITIHHTGLNNKTPWNEYDFYIIKFKNGKEIVFTCLLIGLEMDLIFSHRNLVVIKKNHFVAPIQKLKNTAAKSKS